MGKIFTPKTIIEGGVPLMKNYSDVQGKVLGWLQEADFIRASLIYGSLISDDANNRRDIDWLVVCDSDYLDKARELLSEAVVYARSKNVDLKFRPYDHESALRGDHGITMSFWTHLEYMCGSGGVIKGRPLEYFKFVDHGETHAYAIHIIENLFKGRIEWIIMSEEQQYHFLQKAIEAPIHLARKILWEKKVAYEFYDAKNDTLECYVKHIGGERASLLANIISVDREYSALLEKYAIGYELFLKEYISMIEKIEECIEDVEQFFRLNLNHW